MKSNYKQLGYYIEPFNQFNDGMEIKVLLGISNNKYFQNSHTNTIGIDLQDYRIVRTGQFAYNRATTRNGDKISIALRQGSDCIVSPSYRIFKSKDENILNSEYLMMWFRRPEFDRYARFKSHGSAHEFFEWEQMCEVELPVPHITKQKEIVKEYNTIVNRIALNKQLIQKLEATAQAIYKQWFVDFEFPFDFAQGKPDENGKPYKSNGGEMVESELGEIPKGWRVGSIEDLATQLMGFAFIGEEYSYTDGITVLRGENVTEKNLRWGNHKKWNGDINERIKRCFLQENDIVIGMDGSKVGKNWAIVGKYELPLLLAQRVSCIRAIEKSNQLYIYYSMSVLDFEKHVSQIQTGTSIPHISGQQIFDFPIVIPDKNTLMKFDAIVNKLMIKKMVYKRQLMLLDNISNLLLSKLATIES